MQALTQDELLSLLAAAKAKKERDWLMLLVTYLHGLRASEVTGFKPDAIQDGYLTIQRLKGSKKTVQALIAHENPLLNERQPLIDLAYECAPNQKVFPVGRQHLWTLMQRYGKEAEIPAHKRHPHALKHSLATHIIDLIGVPLTQARLGHQSGNSTLEYTKRTQAEADVATARALGVQNQITV